MSFQHGDNTIVQTDKGLLRGFEYNGIYHFYGIKYADAKRFMPPTEVQPWQGVKDATNYGYMCPNVQNKRRGNNIKNMHRFWPESEHCQYLNIWTKNINADVKKPVIVFFHGGGFFDGSSIEHLGYDGFNLCQKDECVIVTLNHRLNVFGYIDLSDYSDKYNRSKNAGNLDLIAALQWINKNIGAFGGDKDNVTLLGQSGGGMKVTSVMNMPASKGLFSRGMIMSGLESTEDLQNYREYDCREIVKATLDKLGITKENIEELETLEERKFLDTYCATWKQLGNKGVPHFMPAKNEDYLGNPLVYGWSEQGKAAPLIVGSNFSEFLSIPAKYVRNEMNEEEMIAACNAELGKENVDRILPLFKKAFPEPNHKTLDLLSYDCCCIRPDCYNFCKARVEAGCAPTYNYMITPVFKYNSGSPIQHSGDLAIIFNNCSLIPSTDLDGREQDLQDEFAGRLISFAKTGNPQLPDRAIWHPVNAEETPTMIFDRETEERVDFDLQLMQEMGKIKKFKLIVG